MEDWTGVSRKTIVGTDITLIYPRLKERKYAERLKSVFPGGPPAIFSSQLHQHLIPATNPVGGICTQHTIVTSLPDKQHGDNLALFSNQDVTEISRQAREYRKMNQALEANEHYGSEFKVGFEIDLSGLEEVTVNMDTQRITQVLNNLLSNAVKFSPPGESVKVSLPCQNGNVRVSVKDCGPGIPDGYKERIFDKFVQVDSSDSRPKAGTGLGLNIAKLIIKKLGGPIGFETKVNLGSTFYFDLPLWEKNLPSSQTSRIKDDPEKKKGERPSLGNGSSP